MMRDEKSNGGAVVVVRSLPDGLAEKQEKLVELRTQMAKLEAEVAALTVG